MPKSKSWNNVTIMTSPCENKIIFQLQILNPNLRSRLFVYEERAMLINAHATD